MSTAPIKVGDTVVRLITEKRSPEYGKPARMRPWQPPSDDNPVVVGEVVEVAERNNRGVVALRMRVRWPDENRGDTIKTGIRTWLAVEAEGSRWARAGEA